jgi:hypothetical protein
MPKQRAKKLVPILPVHAERLGTQEVYACFDRFGFLLELFSSLELAKQSWQLSCSTRQVRVTKLPDRWAVHANADFEGDIMHYVVHTSPTHL